MAKMKAANIEEITPDGSRAINKFRISDGLIMLVLALLCLTCVLPFIYLAAKSISSNNAVLAKSVYLIPKDITFDAYVSLFKDGSMVRSMIYSVIVTLIFTALGMLACTCAAYPLSKKRLKGRTAFTFLLMVPMYFSAGLIPTYLLFKDLKLLDNMWVLIWPLIYSPYNMLIMKTYLQSSIPDSLEESAFLDGATYIQILFKIVLPLLKPIISTMVILNSLAFWNDFLLPSLVLTDKKLLTLPLSTYSFYGTYSADYGTIMAGLLLCVVPILILYVVLQKQIIGGVVAGAVK